MGVVARVSLSFGALLCMAASLAAQTGGGAHDWPVYGGDKAGSRFSPLTRITRENVSGLAVAWQFDMKEAGESQTNPLVVGRTVYAYTPALNVVALDGASGKQLWKFDAGNRRSGPQRGLVYWTDGKEARLFASAMNLLFALDPATGKPIPTFGNAGSVDLREGLGSGSDFDRYYVSATPPGIVYRDLLIVGFRTSESTPAPPGDVRAYDVHTGKVRWTFHTIPHPGEPGYETWPTDAWKNSGAANSWAGLALDEKRGIVYVPTGSAATDFYGYDRHGDNLYANSLIALDAATGKKRWHFQAVHHDLWDRDFPSPPSLLTVRREGRSIDAVALTSKQGMIYVFDRVSGKPLFPIEERAVPASEVPGEKSAPTQPVPLAPEPFARQRLTEDLLTDRTPAAHTWAVEQFRTFRSGGQFLPLTVGQQTVVFPGFDGGAEWGGSAVDPRRGVLFVNANDLAWSGALVRSRPGSSLAQDNYLAHCATCHGEERLGTPPAIPSLVGVGKRLTAAQITEVVRSGKGRMPANSALQTFALAGLVRYVMNDGVEPPAPATAAAAPIVETPGGVDTRREMTATMQGDTRPADYRFSGYAKFLDPEGYPAVKPPWGTLNAIDLNTGKYLWKIPLGQYPELAAMGMKATGSENYGGPILTASNVLFIGATIFDHKFRAFDATNGTLLWEHDLPYAGTATPATYEIDGRQYVLIGTSNARNPKGPQGGAYVAFALPAPVPEPTRR